VLFVEGSAGPSLDRLWRERIPVLFRLHPFERVVGISKHHLVAMTNANLGLKHRTSTISLGLDALIARELQAKPFDCAVVAWDLVPPWDSSADAQACLREEALLLYGGLSRSQVLPESWRQNAERRHQEIQAHKRKMLSAGPPRPAPNEVLTVCMEPEFEGLLLHEAGVRSVLGVTGKSVRDWPKTWNRPLQTRPSETLSKAIEAARRVKPKPPIFRKLGRSMREAKHDWAQLFLEEASAGFRKHLLQHAISTRLTDVVGAPEP
jgi:hypothetical protein